MKEFLKKVVIKILTWEAKLLLHNVEPKIIAVTGSVGKTSTKDMIYSLISQKFQVRKSEKSFNSDIGVPLTILGLKNAWSNPFSWCSNILLGFWRIFFNGNYPRILVLEVGADAPGDIKKITKWLKPDIAVVTKLADVPVHVANFASTEDIYEEKSHLINALGPDGIAVLNADDERVLSMQNKTIAKKILFGMEGHVDVRGSHQTTTYDVEGKPTGMSFRIDNNGHSIPFEIEGSVGEGHTYSALAAAAVAIAQGMSVLEIAEAAKNIKTPPGRMKLIDGVNSSVIIDDSYNSSPVAVRSALNSLKEIDGKGKKVVALGDMRELGKYSEEEHKKIGRLVPEVADILITVGPFSHFIAEEAGKAGMLKENIFQFEAGESRVAGAHTKSLIKKGDVILVKGSQNTIRMEWFVEEIMAHPELKKTLLVRQDKEWERR